MEASVSSNLDLFYSWQGGRCVLRCVNRLANCACPLTETVIACVLEYFAWRTGGSALEPVLFWWGVLNKIFFILVWSSEDFDEYVSDIIPVYKNGCPDNLIFTSSRRISSNNALHMAPGFFQYCLMALGAQTLALSKWLSSVASAFDLLSSATFNAVVPVSIHSSGLFNVIGPEPCAEFRC